MTYVLAGIGVPLLAALGYFTYRAPRLSSTILWSLVTTIFLTAAIFLAFPADRSEMALYLTVIMPLVWVGLQFLAYWDAHKWRMPAAMLGVSCLSVLVIILAGPIA